MKHIYWWVRDKDETSLTGVIPTRVHSASEGATHTLCGRPIPTDRPITRMYYSGIPDPTCRGCRKIQGIDASWNMGRQDATAGLTDESRRDR